MEYNSRRIAKNTILLYCRMLLLMLITFYTSRLVLNALGVEDFGVANVVGGIIGFLTFLNGSMSLASNRFLSFAIGKKDTNLLKRTFCVAVEIHFLISLVIVLLAETIGLWYFYKYLNIPESTYGVAMLIYQFSIIGCMIGVNITPIIGLIISHEDMQAYAYISILEGGLKLLVAIILTVIDGNRLFAYAIMTFACSLLILGAWYLFYRKKYPQLRFKFIWDKPLFRDFYKFVGCQFIGSFSWIIRNQGASLALNYYFGAALNTARAIAVQVNGGISALMNNFQMAVNPQMVKTFASDNLWEMHRLLFRSSKMSFLLMFILSLPILSTTYQILEFWLKNVPDYAVVFVQLIIVISLFDIAGGTLTQSIVASGKIKAFTFLTSTIRFSNIALICVIFHMGYPPQAMYVAEAIMILCEHLTRLFIARSIINLSIRSYLRLVIVPDCKVICIAAILSIPCILTIRIWPLLFLAELLIAVFTSLYFGLTADERNWMLGNISKFLKKTVGKTNSNE